MEGFKKGFYTTSYKKERKPEVNLGQSSLTQLQPSSQQIQQPGIQQNQEKRNQTLKDTHALTPLSEEKPRKQVASVLHQEAELNPSGMMSMEQLIKVVLNLQKEVKKLHKENVKLTELIQHGLQDELDLRMANQERELDALWNYQRDQNSQTRSQMQQIQDQNSQMELNLQVKDNLSRKWRLKNQRKIRQIQNLQKSKTESKENVSTGQLLKIYKSVQVITLRSIRKGSNI